MGVMIWLYIVYTEAGELQKAAWPTLLSVSWETASLWLFSQGPKMTLMVGECGWAVLQRGYSLEHSVHVPYINIYLYNIMTVHAL